MTVTATSDYAWVDNGVRFFRVTFKGGTYTARCGAFTGRGATLAAAVKRCALCCARPRPCSEGLPF